MIKRNFTTDSVVMGQNEVPHTNTFLTFWATRYALQNPVADFIAPPVLVKRLSDKYAVYTKSTEEVYQTAVGRGEMAKEINWSIDQAFYHCTSQSLAKSVYDEDKENVDVPINLDTDAVTELKKSLSRAREYRVANIFGNSAYITNGTNVNQAWGTASGTPITDILTAKAYIAKKNGGYEANRMVLTLDVALSILKTDEWKNQFKYTSPGFANGLFSVMDGLRNFGIEPMITMVQGTSGPDIQGSTPQFATIWGTNALLFYCEPTPTLQTRTLGYSPYVIKDLIQSVPDLERRRVKHIITDKIDETLVDADCGYLFQYCI